MLIAVITGPSYLSASRQIAKAKSADVLEFRLDLFEKLDLEKIKLLMPKDKKVIFSLRKEDQGGNYNKTSLNRLKDLRDLLSLRPCYLDLEYDVSESFINEIKNAYPNLQIILSYHNFENTPEDLEDLFSNIKKEKVDLYKIAVYANSSLDAMRLMKFIRNKKEKIIGIAMGEKGAFTRIIAPVFNSSFIYAFIDKPVALGQFSINDLMSIYDIKKVNSNTKIYALIGEPVDHSIGHIFHNKRFNNFDQNSIYIKISVNKNELSGFIKYAKDLFFKGFSVTMPLKKEILNFVDKDLSKVGAINTVELKNSKLIGYNTDGKACVSLLLGKINLRNKKVILLGAGGVACAIAHEIRKYTKDVLIFNRDIQKAKKLADKLGLLSFSIYDLNDHIQKGYDIIINATSCSMNDHLIISSEAFKEGLIALDVVSKPIDTIFLKEAKNKGLKTINGLELFIEQAKSQFISN